MSLAQIGQIELGADSEFGSIDVFGAIRRRKWIGLAIIVIGVAVSLVTALRWPPTYQSIATILIEEPDVPDDMVKSTVSTFADERLQLIQQRVMTTQNLSDLIDRFGLYQGALATRPRSEIIEGFRNNIDLEVISANLLGQPNRSNQQRASIAFTVSFNYSDPQLAQQVVSRLTDLYLAENVQSRQQKAAGTTEFMTQQSARLYAEVQALEQKLTEFKSKYAGALPEQFNLNMQILAQAQTQLMQVRRDAESLAQKKAFLQSQIAQLNPYMSVTAQGQAATPQAQLMALELQYVDLSARYGPKHPDVVHLGKQISSLKAQLGTSDDAVSTQAQVSQIEQQLADALQKYGEQHPDVKRLRKQLADLNAEIDKAPSVSMISAPKGPPDNPIYIQLQSQLGDATAEAEGLASQSADLQKKVDELQARVLQTPGIESEYGSLLQQYDGAVKRYQDFRDKESAAQVAQSMEQQSKSETFSVVEAPRAPDSPIKPNRRLIVLGGAVVSCILAGMAMLLLELLDSRVYEPRGLQTAFGQVPLAVVPYISTQRERTRRRLRIAGLGLLAAGIVGGVLIFVHLRVMPLDVLFAAFINRVSP